ncbi:MAG: hypothetical protein KIT51_04850 [Cyclobacteriaceae bacterium]|nr:MAG: hypothetical protein KIT51_04850 [Cyclobacteriaceae bacterium]
MRQYLTFLVIITYVQVWGQSYIPYDVASHQLQGQRMDNIELINSYKFSDLEFYIGKAINGGQPLKMIIKRKDKILGEIFAPDDTFYFRPTFYTNKVNGSPLIILCESGSEYYWGQRVVIIKNYNVKVIGDINIGQLNSNGEIQTIIECTRINQGLRKITISFECNDLILDPGTKNERHIKMNTLYYEIDNDRLTRIEY